MRTPHLALMLSLTLAIDRQWIVGLSRRQAESRLAHFICETYERLKVVGCTTDYRFPFPLSQATLADLTGISLVHANRTVQHLRSTGLIEWESGILSILKPSELALSPTSIPCISASHQNHVSRFHLRLGLLRLTLDALKKHGEAVLPLKGFFAFPPRNTGPDLSLSADDSDRDQSADQN